MATRVFIVDDSELIRHLLRQSLQARPGLEVCGEAHDGAEAVEKACGARPDIVVMDLSMPGMNGLDAGGILRGMLPEAALILFTMHKSDEVSKRAIAKGFDAVVAKSDGAKLFEEIQRLRKDIRNQAAASGKNAS